MLPDMQKLREEHDFSFNKTNVPPKLVPLLNEIEDNKRKWKSLYVAVWGFSFYHLIPIIEKKHGDDFGVWSLPAFRLGGVTYKHNELNKYLTNYDLEIHISHLIKIFTLLESYLFEYEEITKPKQKSAHFLRNIWKCFRKLLSKKSKLKSFTNFETLREYLGENKLATKEELLELEYAKETRNSFVHRRGLVNKRWRTAYEKTGRKNPPKINEKIPINLYDLEDWTDIVINIVNKSLNAFSID